ncbi:MAG TPA: IS1182 family transposase [Candidatus Angelobacter sp.]|nr:IS1182 family transposase [Candidatus Angelobacter sp.]
MAERFVEVDRNTPMLLPADLRDWVPEDDLVHFVIEAVKTLPTGEFVVNERGTGYAQYPPSMMLALVIYCYANGIFSSRRIERASYRDLGVRFLTGDTHPDHDTICSFRRQNEKLIAKFFVRVLELARELKLLQVGTISVDGTRLKANASKHRGVNYQRSGQLTRQLEGEVKELLRKAERADSQGEVDPARLPAEIAKRQELKAKLQAAREHLEKRHREEFAAEVAQYEKKKAAWEKNNRRGGHEPKPPISRGPDPQDQSNLTDPDSRIMRKSKNEAFAQAYNAQLAVDADGSQLILGASVSQSSADNNELKPMLEAVSHNLGQKPRAVLADRGYINGPIIEQIQAQGIEAYVALSAEAHERRPYDLRCEEKRRENPRPYIAPVLVAMEQKLRSPEGRRRYLRRQASIEPVVGIIKKVLGFEQFSLRGLQKVILEWNLVCVAYNLKRLHKLLKPAKLHPPKGPKTPHLTPPAIGELLSQFFSHHYPALQ